MNCKANVDETQDVAINVKKFYFSSVLKDSFSNQESESLFSQTVQEAEAKD